MKAGEVHAVVGENGAGKSTLMKILSGVYKADEGEIIFKGDHVTYTTPREAQEAGITTIYQELVQIPLLSVMENIFLGSEIMRGPFIDWPEMRRQSQKLLEKLRLDVDPRTQLSTLASVFLGGTSVFGGTGSVLGTFIATFIIAAIQPGIVAIGLTGFWTQLIYGLVITLSVSMHTIVRKRFA